MNWKNGFPCNEAGDALAVDSPATGATDDAKVTDPDAADATVIGLLRGILNALDTIATNAAP